MTTDYTDGHGWDDPREAEPENHWGAMRVLNGMQPGLEEKAYENALVVELKKLGHRLEQQKRFNVYCEGVLVDTLVPDLIVDDLIVVDPKVVDEFTPSHVAKMIGYLAVTGFRLALVLNLKHADLRWRRIVRQNVLRTDSVDGQGSVRT